MVAFNQIPANNRVPGAYGEIDGSRAGGQSTEGQHVLFIGYRSSASPVAAGVLKSVVGETDGDGFWGQPSQLATMLRAFRRINTDARVSAVAVDEDAAGQPAVGTITLSGTATKNGTLTVRFGDVRASVAVASGQAAAAIATALATAANAAERNPFTSAAATAVVTATSRHKGTAFNGVTLGVDQGVDGITAVLVQPTGGTNDASLAATIAALDEERYDTVVTGLAGATNLALLEQEFERRWGPTVKEPGIVHAAVAGDHTALTTFGLARNSRFLSVMGSGYSPTPPWIWASQVAARDAQRCDAGTPNRPRKGMTLPDCEAPPRGAATRFDYSERNLLLRSGISTFLVDRSGVVSIERLITTYQTNAAGMADVSYLSVGTVRTLAALLVRWLGLYAKYQDSLLGPDGDDYAPGVPVLTPKGWKGEVAADYDDTTRSGWTKRAEDFKASMIAEIPTNQTDRLDFEATPYIMQGLVTLAFKISFRL